MSEHENFYTPEHVDEQVDAILQACRMPLRDQRLASDLHTLLEHKDEDVYSLQRVLQKFMDGEMSAQQGKVIPFVGLRSQAQEQGRFTAMPDTLKQAAKSPRRRPIFRTLTTLSAVLVVAVLVGSMMLILNASHETHTDSNSTHASPTVHVSPTAHAISPTQIPAGNQGQIIYTSKALSYYTAVVWSPDGSRVAYDADHSTLQTQDALTSQHILTYHTCAGCYTTAIAWSPDGTTLAAAEGSKIYLFNAKTTKLLRVFSSQSIAFNGGGISPLTSTGVAPLSSIGSLAGGASAFSSLAWSADSKSLAAAFNGGNILHRVYVWNVANGSLSKILSNSSVYNIQSVSWSPGGNMLATIEMTASPEVKVWNTTTWQVIEQYSNTTALNWSLDGKQLALVESDQIQSYGHGKDVRIVDTQTWQTVSTFAGPLGETIQNALWSPDGSRLALETQNTTAPKISIWSVTSGKQLYSFHNDKGALLAVWSPDSKYIACIQPVWSSDGFPVAGDPYVLIWVA